MSKNMLIISLFFCSLIILSSTSAQNKSNKIRISAILVKTENKAKLISDSLKTGAVFSASGGPRESERGAYACEIVLSTAPPTP